jgi:hypothetical protein
MAGSLFGIGSPFAAPFAASGIGPYQGAGSYGPVGPVALLPQVAQLLQLVPQQLQQLQQLEWTQQQQLQQIQQLVQAVAYQFQILSQQLGAQGGALGPLAPQLMSSPVQSFGALAAFPSQPLHVM